MCHVQAVAAGPHCSQMEGLILHHMHYYNNTTPEYLLFGVCNMIAACICGT
jgi:hypothetical protein